MSSAWHEIRDHLIKSSSTLGFQRSFDTIRCTQGLLAQLGQSAGYVVTIRTSGVTTASVTAASWKYAFVADRGWG